MYINSDPSFNELSKKLASYKNYVEDEKLLYENPEYLKDSETLEKKRQEIIKILKDNTKDVILKVKTMVSAKEVKKELQTKYANLISEYRTIISRVKDISKEKADLRNKLKSTIELAKKEKETPLTPEEQASLEQYRQ